MPRLSLTEHKKRKEATALRCLDASGKPLSEQSKSVAVQDKKDSCDINRIVKKAIRPDGQVDLAAIAPLAKGQGIYGDFTSAKDWQETQNRVIRMNNAFMRLSPEVRMKFDNDPAKLVDYLNRTEKDSALRDEAVTLGILPKPVFEWKRLSLPEGEFWQQLRDGVEVNRVEIKPKAGPTP